VPCLADDHGVGRTIGDGDGFGRSLANGQPDRPGMRSHLLVGFHAYDAVSEGDQLLRENPGAGAKINDRLRRVADQPLHELGRVAGPDRVIPGGLRAEGAPSSLDVS